MDDSIFKTLPTPEVFAAIQSAEIKKLETLSQSEIRSILPTLVRGIYCRNRSIPLKENQTFQSLQKKIKMKIISDRAVDNILSILNIDFHSVQEDVLKEQQLRQKNGTIGRSFYSDSIQHGLLLEFEKSDSMKSTRLVLSELIRISSQIREKDDYRFLEDDTEIFDDSVYLEEVSDILCISLVELPYLLTAPDVSEALLHVKHGPWILCKMVANNPDCFDVVCSSILSHAKNSDNHSDADSQIRVKTLKMLCHMNPHYGSILRAECVSLCKLAGLAIDLSITDRKEDYKSDLVSFFTGLLLASNSKTREWLSEFIKSSQKHENKDSKSNAFFLFKQQLLKEMEFVIDSFNAKKQNCKMEVDIAEQTETIEPLSNPMMHGIAVMRLYCTLKTISGFKFTPEESEMLIDLIICLPPPTALGVRYVVVGLCTLVACAFLLSTQEREEKITNWLKSLIERSSTFQTESKCVTSYGETLLLIAIHFHGHTLEPIVDLVCSTLGIKLRPASLTKLKILFTQTIFPEKVVAEHALTVSVTKNLNRNMRTFLPAHCILQLMKSRVFTKHSIAVNDWLFKQVCSCSRPIHPLMMELLETYVNAVVNSINISKTKHQRMSALKPFAEEDILSVFKEPKSENADINNVVECYDRTSSQMLLMMYSLVYQHELLANMKKIANNPKAPREYSTHLYSFIPMKQLLIQARSNEQDFGLLYPPMLRLLATHYPHLCLAEDWISEEDELNTQTVSNNNQALESDLKQNHKDLLRDAITRLTEHPQKVVMQLVRLTLLNPIQLIPFLEEVVELLPAMLETHIPRKVQMLVAQLWMKLNTVIPRRLLLKTVNTLRKQPENIQYKWEEIPEYADEEIKKDPLIVLRCNPKVFRCPPAFDILLRTLRGYMTASRALLSHHILSNPLINCGKPEEILATEKDREELRSALISTQESAALQILLEICIPTIAEKKAPNYATKSTLREIQCQVCSFLHQSFISEPKMAKLIHFQGYSPELLPITVSGIPSMHICIDFIPELANQPYLEKQVFAVQLISHLALQYPIPKSFAMSKYVVQRMVDMLAALPVAKRNQFFVPTLKCLSRVCKAFPPIREEVTELLLKIGRVAFSQLNKTSLIANPQIRLLQGEQERSDDEDNTDLEDEEEDFEMDIDTITKDDNVAETSSINEQKIRTLLDNPVHDTSRENIQKCYTSKQLVEEVETIFRTITNFSLRDKLVLLEHEKTKTK